MRKESVEIYSDASNAAVLRHPGRSYPGVLLQGDTLQTLVQSLQVVLAESPSLSEEASDELSDVVERLEEFLAHYKSVLREHSIDLPFYAPPSV
jgi:predicted RNase H-like HicB family nuclease